MSRYIATRAIRGANALVSEAETMLDRALEEKGPETPVAFPSTAYHLPVILGMTGIEVATLGQLTDVVTHARDLLHPLPADHQWTPYLAVPCPSACSRSGAACVDARLEQREAFA